jgi:hypothetical protein
MAGANFDSPFVPRSQIIAGLIDRARDRAIQTLTDANVCDVRVTISLTGVNGYPFPLYGESVALNSLQTLTLMNAADALDDWRNKR